MILVIFRLRAYQKKNAVVSRRAAAAQPAVSGQSSASVTGSDEISVTVGMDELAMSPPHLAWDPEYLLELDPRYVEQEEMEEEEWDSRDEEDEETYYQSDEYTDVEARGADTETVFTESDGELLDRRMRAEETDDGELTAIEERETDFDTEVEQEEEHYKSPGIPRPVLRSVLSKRVGTANVNFSVVVFKKNSKRDIFQDSESASSVCDGGNNHHVIKCLVNNIYEKISEK